MDAAAGGRERREHVGPRALHQPGRGGRAVVEAHDAARADEPGDQRRGDVGAEVGSGPGHDGGEQDFLRRSAGGQGLHAHAHVGMDRVPAVGDALGHRQLRRVRGRPVEEGDRPSGHDRLLDVEPFGRPYEHHPGSIGAGERATCGRVGGIDGASLRAMARVDRRVRLRGHRAEREQRFDRGLRARVAIDPIRRGPVDPVQAAARGLVVHRLPAPRSRPGTSPRRDRPAPRTAARRWPRRERARPQRSETRRRRAAGTRGSCRPARPCRVGRPRSRIAPRDRPPPIGRRRRDRVVPAARPPRRVRGSRARPRRAMRPRPDPPALPTAPPRDRRGPAGRAARRSQPRARPARAKARRADRRRARAAPRRSRWSTLRPGGGRRRRVQAAPPRGRARAATRDTDGSSGPRTRTDSPSAHSARAAQYENALALVGPLRLGRPCASTKFTNSPSPCSIDATKASRPSASSRARGSRERSYSRRWTRAARAASSTQARPSAPSRAGDPVGR